MKYLLVIGDGMAECPLPQLSGKTPMEAANTPCMDTLCAQGQLGLVRTIPLGIAPGSDPGILSIFSYDPVSYTHLYHSRWGYPDAPPGCSRRRGRRSGRP